MAPSHGLLLRLLTSYFSVNIALQYLQTYHDNIGITYYLTRRLASLDTSELVPVWNFLCHLLITRPSRSRALECFVVEMSNRSTHIALLTLWFMQAALKDLLTTASQPDPSFLICQRMLHHCHEIIFSDIPTPSFVSSASSSPYYSQLASLKISPAPPLSILRSKLSSRKKIKHHFQPTVVGIAMALAGVGHPIASSIMGTVAIEQGRVEQDASDIRSIELDDDNEGSGGQMSSPVPLVQSTSRMSASSSTSSVDEQDQGEPHSITNAHDTQSSSPPASRTVPALPLHLRMTAGVRRSRMSEDPLGQLDAELPSAPPLTPSQSQPSLPSTLRAPPIARVPNSNLAESLLQRYDLASQALLLRNHYCRSEVQFILNLENISNRLLVVPRPARVSALRAELTALNHNLPAEVCMPLWCTSSDESRQSTLVPKPHHRIVRIPPGESVVLNSAEKAPYLLYMEVLNDDLDFDPEKRANKQVLKKVLLHEVERSGRTSHPSFDPSSTSSSAAPSETVRAAHKYRSHSLGQDGRDVVGDVNSSYPPPLSPRHPPLAPLPPPTVQVSVEDMAEPDEEEVDLVEQLFGADKSLRSLTPDLSDSIVLPVPPKNKELDMAAWSIPPSPVATADTGATAPPFPPPTSVVNSSQLRPVYYPEGSLAATGIALAPPSSTGGPTTPLSRTSSSGHHNSHTISLDEYSERMRTAAIMLAQLNASVDRDFTMLSMIPGLSSSSDSSTGGAGGNSYNKWIPGSAWLMSLSGSGGGATMHHQHQQQQQPALTLSQQQSSGHEPPQNVAGPLHPSLRASSKSSSSSSYSAGTAAVAPKMRLSHTDAAAIRDRIMHEMIALEEERMDRMREYRVSQGVMRVEDIRGTSNNTVEDESIIRKELDKADPSAAVFSESWSAKKSRIRSESPYGHLANWDCISVIVKTGGDLRQEQLAVQLIREFQRIWREENIPCWVRPFQIVITGGTSGLVETVTDAVSIHSIKKAEYARRLAMGGLGHVSLLDHFKATYGDPSSAKYARAQKNFAQSLAGYSLVCFLLQIKDRHNGNILLDREGHVIHIDFGFILSNSPGNVGFEAAPFKLPMEYVEVLGGIDAPPFLEFRRLFHEGFKAARKHCDRIITLVELMQKDSTMPCFAAFGQQTAPLLRDRFQPALTHMLVGEYVDKLIDSSLFSNWTRLYDTFQYYTQSIL